MAIIEKKYVKIDIQGQLHQVELLRPIEDTHYEHTNIHWQVSGHFGKMDLLELYGIPNVAHAFCDMMGLSRRQEFIVVLSYTDTNWTCMELYMC